mmetsp:Transcript_33849/g.100491  ORF Transcript_33849/g.100491 Transcript_33849/m.100491 type:complete len:962 (+) Transcript_33849:217-3102(+)
MRSRPDYSTRGTYHSVPGSVFAFVHSHAASLGDPSKPPQSRSRSAGPRATADSLTSRAARHLGRPLALDAVREGDERARRVGEQTGLGEDVLREQHRRRFALLLPPRRLRVRVHVRVERHRLDRPLSLRACLRLLAVLAVRLGVRLEPLLAPLQPVSRVSDGRVDGAREGAELDGFPVLLRPRLVQAATCRTRDARVARRPNRGAAAAGEVEPQPLRLLHQFLFPLVAGLLRPQLLHGGVELPAMPQHGRRRATDREVGLPLPELLDERAVDERRLDARQLEQLVVDDLLPHPRDPVPKGALGAGALSEAADCVGGARLEEVKVWVADRLERDDDCLERDGGARGGAAVRVGSLQQQLEIAREHAADPVLLVADLALSGGGEQLQLAKGADVVPQRADDGDARVGGGAARRVPKVPPQHLVNVDLVPAQPPHVVAAAVHRRANHRRGRKLRERVVLPLLLQPPLQLRQHRIADGRRPLARRAGGRGVALRRGRGREERLVDRLEAGVGAQPIGGAQQLLGRRIRVHLGRRRAPCFGDRSGGARGPLLNQCEGGRLEGGHVDATRVCHRANRLDVVRLEDSVERLLGLELGELGHQLLDRLCARAGELVPPPDRRHLERHAARVHVERDGEVGRVGSCRDCSLREAEPQRGEQGAVRHVVRRRRGEQLLGRHLQEAKAADPVAHLPQRRRCGDAALLQRDAAPVARRANVRHHMPAELDSCPQQIVRGEELRRRPPAGIGDDPPRELIHPDRVVNRRQRRQQRRGGGGGGGVGGGIGLEQSQLEDAGSDGGDPVVQSLSVAAGGLVWVGDAVPDSRGVQVEGAAVRLGHVDRDGDCLQPDQRARAASRVQPRRSCRHARLDGGAAQRLITQRSLDAEQLGVVEDSRRRRRHRLLLWRRVARLQTRRALLREQRRPRRRLVARRRVQRARRLGHRDAVALLQRLDGRPVELHRPLPLERLPVC